MSDETNPTPQIAVPQNAEQAKELMQRLFTTVLPSVVVKVKDIDDRLNRIEAKLEKIRGWLQEMNGALQRPRT